MIHEIKIYPEFFKQVADGVKPFELRKNDRDYKDGDRLFLREYCPAMEAYTERYCFKGITYVLKGGSFGLDSDYVILGLIEDNEIVETLKGCIDELALTKIDEADMFDFVFSQVLDLISSVQLFGKSEIVRQEMISFISTHKQSELSNKQKFKVINTKVLKMIAVATDLS